MADARDIPSLAVGGSVYSGWKSMTLTRSIEAVAGGFDLDLTERWDGQTTRWPIDPGDAAELRLGGERVLSGYVDQVERGIEADSHKVKIAGRDRTGDLVDCSAVHEPDEFNGLDLAQLASAIAQPFGVKVTAAVDVGAVFAPFKIEPAETAYAAIERACRMRAVLPMGDGNGGLLLTRAGMGRAAGALIEGQNVKSASMSYGWKERHSRYIVKSQTPDLGLTEPAPGLPGAGPGAGALLPAAKGEATDRSINRYRPLLLLAEMPADGPSATERAAWEAGVRAGRSVKVTVVVQGWRQANGQLWPLNGLCQVRLPSLDINDQLLITGLRFSFAESGSLTEITLTRADAFRLIVDLSKGKKSQGIPPGTEIIKSLEQLKR